MIPANMNAFTTAIGSATECATLSTMFYQVNSFTDTVCNGATCVGVSQPLFGVAEEWTAAANNAFYLVGAMEYGAAYGQGAYEIRTIKISYDGAEAWDTGAANGTHNSNCLVPLLVHDVGAGACTAADRSNANSVWLTARFSDNNDGANNRYFHLGGVLLTAQNPMMYKNGW